MTEDEYKAKIQELIIDRDEWRNTALRQESDLESLRQELELQKRVAHAYIAAPAESLINELREVMVERDQAIKERTRIVVQIEAMMHVLANELKEAKGRWEERLENLREIDKKTPLDYVAKRWLYIASITEKQFLKTLNIYERQLDIPSPTLDIIPRLNSLSLRVRGAVWWDIQGLIFATAIGISDDPQMVCCQIMSELSDLGETKMETVNRLKGGWLERYINNRLGEKSHATLYTAINQAYKFKSEKMNLLNEKGIELRQVDYATKNHVSVDTLNLYVRYLEKIEEHSKKVPDYIKDAIENAPAYWRLKPGVD